MKQVPKIKSIKEMLFLAKEDAPNKIAYKFKDAEGNVVSKTFREFFNDTEALGAAITKMGYGNTHIACVGENSYKWIVTYLTALKTAGTFVPFDKELPADDLVKLINDSDSTVIFCDEKHEQILRENISKLTNIKNVICFDREEDDKMFLSFDNLVSSGLKLNKKSFDALENDDNDMKLLVYTSGTTGNAKGVMLSQHNLTSAVYYGLQVSQIKDIGLSVLPYHHTYEAVCGILVAIHFHATLCINESYRVVSKNLKLYHPEYIYIVPMFADFFKNAVLNEIEKKGKKKIFDRMIKITRALRKIGIDVRRLVFRSVHKGFGGKLKMIVCGGAPVKEETGKFFDDIGINFYIGYGITECSPLVSVNKEMELKFGAAGHRLPCLEWRIDSPKDGIGEICVRGDVVMLGYYKRDDLTAEAIKDGWFYTGDYGYITPNDEIVITGRKKNIIVLNNGKNIYPEEIEEYISEVKYINEVVVKGISDKNGGEIGLLAEVYCEEPHDKHEILSDIRKAQKNLPMYKMISDVIIRSEPFPKTTTQKIKR